MRELDEFEMAAGCKSGDARIQQYVFRKYYGLMLGLCLRYANDREEARDMLQESFVKIFDKIEQYNEDYSFVGWMKRIVVNTAIDHYRRSARMPMSEDESILENESIEADAISMMGYEEIINLIQRLPSGYRTVFNLYVIEGYTHKEIADELGIAEGTSKSQLNKAKAILKKKIEEQIAFDDNERA